MRFEKRSSRNSCSTHQQQPISRPQLESLEQRQLLSAAVSHAVPALYVLGPIGIVTPIAPVPPIHIISPIAFTTGNVTGQVTDADGNPLANARVSLRSTLPGVIQPMLPAAGPAPLWAFPQVLRPQTRVYSATTDAQGNYTIDHVLTGSYTVTAYEKGYANNTSPVFTVSTFTVDAGATIAPTVQLTALVYGNVTGQITDADGNPLAKARVCLQPAPTGIAQPMLGSADGAMISVYPIGLPTGQRYLATTDANGNYTIDHVLAGDYTVTARDKGYVNNTSSTFTVAAGDNTAPTVQLTALVYGNVTGQVTDADGNSLANARVCLQSAPTGIAQPLLGNADGAVISVYPAAQRYFATTDATGNYTISHVLAGDYTVTARDKGYLSNTASTFTVAAGDNTAPTVELTPRVKRGGILLSGPIPAFAQLTEGYNLR